MMMIAGTMMTTAGMMIGMTDPLFLEIRLTGSQKFSGCLFHSKSEFIRQPLAFLGGKKQVFPDGK